MLLKLITTFLFGYSLPSPSQNAVLVMFQLGLINIVCIPTWISGRDTSVEVLGFPKINIEGKPRENFQTNCTKLMLQHKGGIT